jgi:hypothetical protein
LGRPLQLNQTTAVEQRQRTSVLEIALETRNHALVLLLLCNGYDPNLEPRFPLDLAFRTRRWDLLAMLLEWGADPHRVNLSDLIDSFLLFASSAENLRLMVIASRRASRSSFLPRMCSISPLRQRRGDLGAIMTGDKPLDLIAEGLQPGMFPAAR